MASRITSLDFIGKLQWLDGSPLLDHVEPYRRRIFTQALDELDGDRPRYNLILSGRAKKNWKSADLILAAMYCALTGESRARVAECYLLANDADQARDDLQLAKALVKANGELTRFL